MRALSNDAAPRVRWRNDGGWTREIIREPSGCDDFDWRVSVAEVETDGPFSAFDGYDRVLVLLDGAGMDLRLAGTGATTSLRPDDRTMRFAGEAPIEAALVGGPTTDFNLIWRRTALAATAHHIEGCQHVDVGGDAAVIAGAYVVSGRAALVDGRVAMAGDTFISEPGERLHLDLDGSLVVFVLAPLSAAERGLAGLTVVERADD
jgi:uncharacterized protein